MYQGWRGRWRVSSPALSYPSAYLSSWIPTLLELCRRSDEGFIWERFDTKGQRWDTKMSFLGYRPIKNGAHPSTVGTASVDMKAGGQQDAVFDCDWTMREGGDEQLIPAWKKPETLSFSLLSTVHHMDSRGFLKVLLCVLRDLQPRVTSVTSRGQCSFSYKQLGLGCFHSASELKVKEGSTEKWTTAYQSCPIMKRSL